MITDPTEVANLREAYFKVKALEKAAIERGRLWLEMNNKPFANFQNGNGYSVRTDLDSLLDESAESVFFYHTDVQGRGDTNTITIPRDFIFSANTPTAEEQEYAEYLRLKDKFEKK